MNNTKKYESFIAALFLLIPLILITIDGTIQSSISAYAYTTSSRFFVFLLTFSGTLFLRKGVREWKSRWYNVILGLSLFVVAWTPYKDFTFPHFFSAAIFFVGSIFVMIFYSNRQQRPCMILLGSIIFLGLFGHFALNLYSLLWAEWIGMIPISIHFIGETLNKIE